MGQAGKRESTENSFGRAPASGTMTDIPYPASQFHPSRCLLYHPNKASTFDTAADFTFLNDLYGCDYIALPSTLMASHRPQSGAEVGHPLLPFLTPFLMAATTVIKLCWGPTPCLQSHQPRMTTSEIQHEANTSLGLILGGIMSYSSSRSRP